MPELPEVERFRRYVDRHALRQKIVAVEVVDARILDETSPGHIKNALTGRMFTRTSRHGKHLFVATARSGWLHLHFGMTGDLSYRASTEMPTRFAKVIFHFSNGRALAFEDARLFGFVALVDSASAEIERRRLGPDPLDLKLSDFRSIFEKRRGAVKALLMNQSSIAGLGNLYVDEILYAAALHPRTDVSSLPPEAISRLHRAMRSILSRAITLRTSGHDVPAKWLFRHRDVDDRCPRCGGAIARTVVFGRTTYFCSRHQTL